MKNARRILCLLLGALMVLSLFTMIGCSEEEGNNEKNNATLDEKRAEHSISEFFGTDWINAAEFGIKGDGKTANDVKFAEYIKYYSTVPLYFPEGVYCFEKTLDFPDSVYIKMDPNAELKCIAKEPIDYFITMRHDMSQTENAWSPFFDMAVGSSIDGGKINCNWKAKCALGVAYGIHTNFENFMIVNALEKGIETSWSKTPNSTANFSNIYLYNEKSLPGTIGIYDNGADNHFYGVTVVNFETGFYTGGGRFVECSAWNNDMATVENMTFAEIVGTQSIWIGPSVDTVRYGFKLHDGASTSISDLVWITNIVMYKKEMQEQYPRTIFWAENPEEAKFMVTGLQIPWEQGPIVFSNAELPKSTFLNVRLPDGMDGPSTLAYFRDDSSFIRDLMAEANRDKGTFTATGKTDFNTLKEPGIYECALASGKGGANLPPKAEKGVLEVSETNGRIFQRFFGQTYTAYRFFNGAKWGEWTLD